MLRKRSCSFDIFNIALGKSEKIMPFRLFFVQRIRFYLFQRNFSKTIKRRKE